MYIGTVDEFHALIITKISAYAEIKGKEILR